MIDYNSMMNNPMMGLGMQLLANSGPSMTPTSFGQRLGNAGLGHMQNQMLMARINTEMKLREKQAKRMDEQIKLVEKQMKLQEKEEQLRERAANIMGQAGDAYMPGAPQNSPENRGQRLVGLGMQLNDPNMMKTGIGMTPTELKTMGVGGGTALYEEGPYGRNYLGMGPQRRPSAMEELEAQLAFAKRLRAGQPCRTADGKDGVYNESGVCVASPVSATEEESPGFFDKLFSGWSMPSLPTPKSRIPTYQSPGQAWSDIGDAVSGYQDRMTAGQRAMRGTPAPTPAPAPAPASAPPSSYDERQLIRDDAKVPGYRAAMTELTGDALRNWYMQNRDKMDWLQRRRIEQRIRETR
jgi:hypothetical protein